jgi:4-aminobutyrate aminotransferase-like enzyme
VSIGKMSQVCACLYTADYNPKPGLLSGTFIGSTVGLKVGHRSLQRMRDGGYYGNDGRIARLYEQFVEHAEALGRKHPEWFPPIEGMAPDTPRWGGIGGMMRFTPFGGRLEPVKALLGTMFRLGVIAFYCGHGPYHVRFLPPVGVMRPEQFGEVFEIIEAAMEQVVRETAH